MKMNLRLLNPIEMLSWPGVSILIRSKHLAAKLVWLVCILTSIGTGVFILKKNFESYLKYEVITNTNVIREEASQFPAISFCMLFNVSKLLPNASSILYSCFFETKNCSWNDFEIYNTNFGSQYNFVCYRFNSGKNISNEITDIRNSTLVGLNFGLVVTFNLSVFGHSMLFTDSKMSIRVDNSSALFKVTDLNNKFSPLPPGINSIKIEREFIQKRSTTNSKCVMPDTADRISDLFQYFKKIKKTYRQEDCFDLCIQEKAKQRCNCTQEIGAFSNCLNKQSIIGQCLFSVFADYVLNKLKFLNECDSFCPRECSSIAYKTYQSYWGSSLLGRDNQKERFDTVYVFYSELGYKMTRQNLKMNTSDLLSSIGGNLGFFIGLSIISVIEILQIFFESLSNVFKSRKDKMTSLPPEDVKIAAINKSIDDLRQVRMLNVDY